MTEAPKSVFDMTFIKDFDKREDSLMIGAEEARTSFPVERKAKKQHIIQRNARSELRFAMSSERRVKHVSLHLLFLTFLGIFTYVNVVRVMISDLHRWTSLSVVRVVDFPATKVGAEGAVVDKAVAEDVTAEATKASKVMVGMNFADGDVVHIVYTR